MSFSKAVARKRSLARDRAQVGLIVPITGRRKLGREEPVLAEGRGGKLKATTLDTLRSSTFKKTNQPYF